MTPEVQELRNRGKELLRRNYGGTDITRRVQFTSGDVTIKHDTGVVSILVQYKDREHLIYVETPSGDFVGPPGHASDPVLVRHALDYLRSHMVLDDLAEI